MNKAEQGFNPESLRPDKKIYEDLLWKEADKISKTLGDLQELRKQLEQSFTADLSSLNLHQLELRRNDEAEYWQLKDDIQQLQTKEQKIQKFLEDLGNDRPFNEKEIKDILDQEEMSGQKLSKRKQRILEEQERLISLGHEPNFITGKVQLNTGGEFGADSMALTTSRHQKSIKHLGAVTPESAANEFFYRTADTHGGKVKHGKSGNKYVSKSGKRIKKH